MDITQQTQRPAYEAPTIITYTNEEILDELGAAQTGSGNPFGGADDGPFPA